MKTNKKWQISKKLKRSKKTGTVRGEFCAVKNNSSFSCFTRSSLKKIIDNWNEHNNDKINYNPSDSNEILWDKIDQKMSNNCTTEYCWKTNLKGIADDEINSSFLPPMPGGWHENRQEWLSSTDITRIMKQYQITYEDFAFIGPVPIDFDYEYDAGKCIVNELCNIKVSQLLSKGKKKLGIIFNLDRHDEPGSHWVSLFVDFEKHSIYYYDSTSTPPPEEIIKLMHRIKQQASLATLNMNIHINDVRHQYKDSECGVYSIYFISQMLKGESFTLFKKNIIYDDGMNKMRENFFNPLVA
jgi:hypothetical protein